jgi:hypothetical protein
MTVYMTLAATRRVADDREALAAHIGIPYPDWAKKCHEISFDLLKTGLFGPGRIARGWAPGILGQHSWIVLGHNVYAPNAVIVDPTLSHWQGTPELGIFVDKAENMQHTPHGKGSIWGYGRPDEPAGNTVELTPAFELSQDARNFLSWDVLGPLDRMGWNQLANGVMEEWPSDEIIAAMDDTPALRTLVPIDILGMVTDRNPLRRYLADVPDTSSYARS